MTDFAVPQNLCFIIRGFRTLSILLLQIELSVLLLQIGREIVLAAFICIKQGFTKAVFEHMLETDSSIFVRIVRDISPNRAVQGFRSWYEIRYKLLISAKMSKHDSNSISILHTIFKVFTFAIASTEIKFKYPVTDQTDNIRP